MFDERTWGEPVIWVIYPLEDIHMYKVNKNGNSQKTFFSHWYLVETLVWGASTVLKWSEIFVTSWS